MSSLARSLEKFCCCKGDESDDEMLVRAEEREWPHQNATRSSSGRLTNNNGFAPLSAGVSIGSNTAVAGSLTAHSHQSSSQPTARTQDEEEEDALNRILDKTQQSIIDVSNMDSNALDVDVVQRARLYSEAVKRHDAIIEKRKSPFGTPPVAVLGTNAPMTNGPTIVSVSRENSISRQSSSSVHHNNHNNLPDSQRFLDAEARLKLSQLFHTPEQERPELRVECREELIAYMSLDD